MRDLAKVIDKLLEVIPASYTGLRESLKREKKTAAYMPPEMSAGHWQHVGSLLSDWLGESTDTDLGMQVATIFREWQPE